MPKTKPYEDPTIYGLAFESKMNAVRERLLAEAAARRQAAQKVSEQQAWVNRLKEEDKPLEDPWIDPVSAAAGGFAGSLYSNLGKLGTSEAIRRAITSGATGAAADYPIGIATEKVGEKFPGLALPFNVLTGLTSGMTLERMAENAINNPKVARILANQTGSVGGDVIKPKDIDLTAHKAKEPWEMGYEELRKAVSPDTIDELQISRPILKTLYPEKLKDPGDPWGIVRAVEKGDEIPRTPVVDLSKRHRASIKQALAEGKPVPPEVLKDYPDLSNTKEPGDITTKQASESPKGGKFKNTQEVIDDIKQEIFNDDDEYITYALRVIPDDADYIPKKGDVQGPSYLWEDGEITDDLLDGTSAIEIKRGDIQRAINGIGAKPHNDRTGPNGYYSGDTVVLLKGERVSDGIDVDEAILKNPTVIAVYKKANSQQSQIISKLPSPSRQAGEPGKD